MGEIKCTSTPAQLCTGKGICMLPFMEIIDALKFDETPNYGYLRHLLLTILLDKDMAPSVIYDWSRFNVKPLSRSNQIESYR